MKFEATKLKNALKDGDESRKLLNGFVSHVMCRCIIPEEVVKPLTKDDLYDCTKLTLGTESWRKKIIKKTESAVKAAKDMKVAEAMSKVGVSAKEFAGATKAMSSSLKEVETFLTDKVLKDRERKIIEEYMKKRRLSEETETETESVCTEKSRKYSFEANLYDMSDWVDGPWKKEVDFRYWVDFHTGYDCIVARNEDHGGLLGFVGINNEDLFNKIQSEDLFYSETISKSYVRSVEDSIVLSRLYDSKKLKDSGDIKIPYILKNNFWIRRDVNISFDVLPRRSHTLDEKHKYKSMNYMMEECEFLAKQIERVEE